MAFTPRGRGHGSEPVRHTQAGGCALTGEDRLIDGDDQVTGPRFGRPPGEPGTLVSGQHPCALDQGQDGHQRVSAAVERGALAAGDLVMHMAVRRELDPAGFRAPAVVIGS